MAPIPEWIHAVIHHQQLITSDASFAEKAIVLLVVGHILVLYTTLCWLGARTMNDTRDHRKIECLEGQFELELELEPAIQADTKSSLRNTARALPP